MDLDYQIPVTQLKGDDYQIPVTQLGDYQIPVTQQRLSDTPYSANIRYPLLS